MMNVGILKWKGNKRMKRFNRIIGQAGGKQMHMMNVNMIGLERVFLLIVITSGECFKRIYKMLCQQKQGNCRVHQNLSLCHNVM